MAALTLADELSETKEKLQRLEPELAALQDASVVSADRANNTQAAVAAALNAAAERIEIITKRLNQTVGDGGVPMGIVARGEADTHYIGRAGLRGACGAISPGPYRSLRELSLAGLVGSDIWRPPTFVGNPGSSSNGHRGSALLVFSCFRSNVAFMISVMAGLVTGYPIAWCIEDVDARDMTNVTSSASPRH